jgi:hypothetical protein
MKCEIVGCQNEALPDDGVDVRVTLRHPADASADPSSWHLILRVCAHHLQQIDSHGYKDFHPEVTFRDTGEEATGW